MTFSVISDVGVSFEMDYPLIDMKLIFEAWLVFLQKKE